MRMILSQAAILPLNDRFWKEVKRLPYEKKSLGEKLRKLRESYNLSQKQVAEALNIDRSTYTYYEKDKTRPSLETLVKISRIFNVPTATLLPDDNGKQITFRDIARSDGLLITLSKEERGLIVYYRSLSTEDQAKVLAEMAKLAKKPQWRAAKIRVMHTNFFFTFAHYYGKIAW